MARIVFCLEQMCNNVRNLVVLWKSFQQYNSGVVPIEKSLILMALGNTADHLLFHFKIARPSFDKCPNSIFTPIP